MSGPSESSAVNEMHGASSSFEWKSDYDEILEQIASTDQVETDWDLLRDMLKYKFARNFTDFILNPKITRPRSPPHSPESNPTLSPKTLTSGGLRLPPFPKREVDEKVRNENNSYRPRKSLLSEEEAQKIKETISMELDEFESQPPYTIQRLCELAIRPRQHYTNIGKYMRAIETSLLVTSTWDEFPQSKGESSTSSNIYSNSILREASTPLFVPIPFLHDDARRSRSQSPPMSPLDLPTKRQLSPHIKDDLVLAAAAVESNNDRPGGPAIGLVDELDDPSPGHMSKHPTALTAVTSAGAASIHASLEERFTKGTEDALDSETSDAKQDVNLKEKEKRQQDEEAHEVEDMVLDEPDDDKENKG